MRLLLSSSLKRYPYHSSQNGRNVPTFNLVTMVVTDTHHDQYHYYFSTKNGPNNNNNNNNDKNNNTLSTNLKRRKKRFKNRDSHTLSSSSPSTAKTTTTTKISKSNNKNNDGGHYQRHQPPIFIENYNDKNNNNNYSSSSSIYNYNTNFHSRKFMTVNASALLDPKTYCKKSAFYSNNRGISGMDATRRLLRGKKELVEAIREQINFKQQQQQPDKQQKQQHHAFIVEGHGIPPQLLQHVIDMAYNVLLHYDENAVECTFNNYHRHPPEESSSSSSLLPQLVRVRNKDKDDTTNHCFPWPLEHEDLNHAMNLYLTSMEKMALKLGIVLKSQNNNNNHRQKQQHDNGNHSEDYENDNDDTLNITSSPLLFQSLYSSKPLWNVDILRGLYYNNNNKSSTTTTTNSNNSNGKKKEMDFPPVPIVEWSPNYNASSGILGHVLIRLQGYSKLNPSFVGNLNINDDGIDGRRGPVTLVFDAWFRQ